ncbi:MAG: trifunctional transcriptional regulator/proline dehydrogenase/L-glutamate gamma-semialdehyde dehydrogenase, partial [Xanthobacteraceae bacterium]
RAIGRRSALGFSAELDGPVGERNLYTLHPRGRLLLAPQTASGLFHQLAATLATGNAAVIDRGSRLDEALPDLPERIAARVTWSAAWEADGPFAGALVEGDADRIKAVALRVADCPGPLVPVQAASMRALQSDPDAYCTDWLLEEISTSINTAAAGGNASLMTLV